MTPTEVIKQLFLKWHGLCPYCTKRASAPDFTHTQCLANYLKQENNKQKSKCCGAEVLGPLNKTYLRCGKCDRALGVDDVYLEPTTTPTEQQIKKGMVEAIIDPIEIRKAAELGAKDQDQMLQRATEQQWEKDLMDLKCVNSAMYFGSVEDDTCNCKTRCQNEQTFDHAVEELKAFISRTITASNNALLEKVEADIEKAKSFGYHRDHRSMSQIRTIIRSHITSNKDGV